VNSQPSEQDIKITQKLKEAGQLFDLNILDHIIMLPEGYVSLADEGYF
jgi:DNA repair protein RadC